MTVEPYFFHGIRRLNLDALYKIIDSGYILPRSMLNGTVTDCNNIFNGNSWISISQKSLYDPTSMRYFRDSYSEWIPNNLCIVINPNIKDIRYTNYIDADEFYPDERKRLVKDESDTRYSYYIDEVQTKKPIFIEDFLAIGYPLERFKSIKSQEEIDKDLETIYSMLEQKGITIPVLNSSIESFADNEKQMILSKIKRPKK